MNDRITVGFQCLLAVGMAVVLGIAAKRSFLLGDVRVIGAYWTAQEPDFQYPLTPAQEEYKKKRDEREMSTAKREREESRRLGRLLIYAQALPVALLASAAWFFLSHRNLSKTSNTTSDGIRQPADGSPKPSM